MIDDIQQIAGAGGMLYGLGKSGKLYFLSEPDDIGEAHWVLIAKQNKLRYLPPKQKPDATSE